MATTFTLTDGTTTVQLNNGSACYVMEYNQTQQAESDEAGLAADYAVTESMILMVVGATPAAVRTTIRSIETLLETAKRRSAVGVGARVFIQVQFDGDTQAWRSELYEGRLTAETIADSFWRGKVEAQFTFVRGRVWEGGEVELPLTAQGYGSPATGGRQITNNGTNAWIEIDGAQIDGTAPALARLRLQNITGATRRVTQVYVGNNAFVTPSTFGNIIQGESYAMGFGTVGSNALSSNGQYAYASLNTTKTIRFKWRFTSAQMAAGGRWFRVIARTQGQPPAGTFVRLSIQDYDGLLTQWTSGVDVMLSTVSDLHDLGPIPIPPGDYGTDYSQSTLVIEAWMATGTGTLNIDYLALMGLDGYRSMESYGCDVLNNEHVEIDEINRRYTWINGSALKSPAYAPYGSPLVLYPGITQRMYVIHGYAISVTADNFRAQLWYRPARFTV